jgi:hypothetical protein
MSYRVDTTVGRCAAWLMVDVPENADVVETGEELPAAATGGEVG